MKISKSFQRRKRKKKKQYGREQSKNFSKYEKQKLVVYRTRYYEKLKNTN